MLPGTRGRNWILLAAMLAAASALSIRAEDEKDDPDSSGLGAAAEQIKIMLPLAMQGGRLVLDQDAWRRADEAQTPEQRRAAVAERLSKRMHTTPDKVPPQLIDNQINMAGGSGSTPVDAFQGVIDAIGGGYGGSSSFGNRSHSLHCDNLKIQGMLNINSDTSVFDMKLAEKTGSRRTLDISDSRQTGLTVHYANGARELGYVFLQSPHGPAVLAAYHGKRTASLAGDNFLDLYRKDPGATMEFFIRPLMDLGVDLPFSQNHPAVMSVVAFGFNASTDPELKARMDALAKALADDELDVRIKAQKDAVALYPSAIFEFTQLRDTTQDPETRKRINTVIDGYPALQLAREFATVEKLQDNRDYLRELLGKEKYRAGARARLTSLYGKDYGDDPAAWPK